MVGAKYPLASKVMEEMTDFFVDQMKLELLAKRKRESIRASWKRVGNGWQPKSVEKKSYKGNYVASGNLLKSIKPSGAGLMWQVSMASYGNYVAQGRPKGKGIPVSAMKGWIKDKKIKPRNLDNGQFINQSSKNMNAMSFMMNRKIKYFGIKPFDFIGIAKDSTTYKYKSKLSKAFRQDIINNTTNEL